MPHGQQASGPDAGAVVPMTLVIAHRGASADERENTHRGVRARDRGRRRLRRARRPGLGRRRARRVPRPQPRPADAAPRPAAPSAGSRARRGRHPDARARARGDPRPDRRDGGAEERVPLPASRPGPRARSRCSRATTSSSPSSGEPSSRQSALGRRFRSLQHVGFGRVRSEPLPGMPGASDSRTGASTARALSRARDAGLARARLHGQRGGADARAHRCWASTGSSPTVPPSCARLSRTGEGACDGRSSANGGSTCS